MYLINDLIKDFQSGKRLKYLFFWGHQPSKDGSISSSCFSQWWISDFVIEEITYPSAEHFMMAEKARLFNDDEMLDKILNSSSPAQAKKFGRNVKGFNPELWDENKLDIVTRANMAKFSQNQEMKDFLINTNKRVIVEASPVDRIWGIGLAKDSTHAENPLKWRGENLLGFALMEVREQLKKN